MGRKKQDTGTQRTFQIMVRFKPEVQDRIEEVVDAWIAKYSVKANPEKGIKERRLTVSEFVRMAVWELCKLPDDPRKP